MYNKQEMLTGDYDDENKNLDKKKTEQEMI